MKKLALLFSTLFCLLTFSISASAQATVTTVNVFNDEFDGTFMTSFASFPGGPSSAQLQISPNFDFPGCYQIYAGSGAGLVTTTHTTGVWTFYENSPIWKQLTFSVSGGGWNGDVQVQWGLNHSVSVRVDWHSNPIGG
ncbi:hypothetical protein SAMN05660461_6013 [Chitinophaga ginsengisegetis]|uniref:Uncharacterized protein n=1 Tax=Chitinophaga ginsengisegetis TaxID=393003 RepID=A0A1T5PBX3_9BACT|nr:hypothetical protein [Chitinophaga ginsengisegetis]SKD10113.1 hypothetical protein SAMN05660461_6013 [Chitinophaga ginsengisegetis]